MSRFNALRMAVGTLTVVPVPAPTVIDREVARGAMLLGPIAALPLALAAALVVLTGEAVGMPSLLIAALAVGAVALGSRGLHLDGLADTADGLAASYDREKALTIMRKGDSGPSGVATLTLVLLVQCAALAGAVTAGHGVLAAVTGVLAGRMYLAVACARGVPSARPSGLGATVAGSVPVPAAAFSALACGCLAVFVCILTGLPWWQGLLAIALALVVAGALLVRCVRRLGGITGDVLGATVEAATAGALIALSW